MKIRLLSILLSLFSLAASSSSLPKVYLVDPKHLQENKDRFLDGDARLVEKVSLLKIAADKLLNVKPNSVMDKDFTPLSGTKHDYMSMGPYWWPDPSKKDGLPYIRKDGQRNPEIRKISDHDFLSDLESKCQILALAYYFTGEEKYAFKASELIKSWFLNPETKMNPNLEFAQAIPGLNNGRGIGIIESRWFANIADWAGLLEGSKSFTTDDLSELKDWYSKFLNWMMTSKNGLDEKESKNNHGTFYELQVASFALFTGKPDLAKRILSDARKRIDVQILEDGRQPLELERTNAYSYSTMNLSGWFGLATLGEKSGVDFWHYQSNGKTLKSALDWLLPYALEEKARTYSQISNFNKNDLYYLLVIAADKYVDKRYEDLAKALEATGKNYAADLLYN